MPPESKVLDVKVTPSAKRYEPGAKGEVKILLTDRTGEPFAGTAVVSIYDKAVEYISGGGNVPEIKAFFWKWRRHHNPVTDTNLEWGCANLLRPKTIGMSFLGVFGYSVADELTDGMLGGKGQDRSDPPDCARLSYTQKS